MALNGVAWWAVMIFVFVAGLELDTSQLWTNRVETGVTAGLALATPLVFGTAAALGLVIGQYAERNRAWTATRQVLIMLVG